MSNNKIFAVIAACLVVIAGCAAVYIILQDDGPEGSTITDSRGREVAIPEEIDSILAIKSCSLELVSFFDAVNKVTYLDINEAFDSDRTHNIVMNDKLKDLPKVDPNNAESVAVTGVDLIISSTISKADLDNEQTKYGVPVFGINADIEFGQDFSNQIMSLGTLFGEEQRANDIVNGINGMIAAITDNIPAGEGPTAYACGMNYFGAASTPFLRTTGDYLPFKYTGLTNVMPSKDSGSGVPRQPFNTDIETVLKADPQYIFVDGVGADAVKTYINDNLSVKDMSAVKDGHVYKTMVYKAWGTNWQNQLINVYYVAKVMYPDVFTWDFNEEANNILQLFYPGTEVTYDDIVTIQSGGGCGQLWN